MARIVYVLPGENIEVRVCDPIFEEGASASTWKLSMDPSSILIGVNGFNSITVLPRTEVREAFTDRQLLVQTNG